MNRVVRSLAAVAVAAVLLAGCAKRSHGLVVAGVGLAATVASGVAVAECSDDGCGSVVLLLVPSGALLISGLVGALTAASPEAAPPPSPSTSPVIAAPGGQPGGEPDPEAVSLTARARMAADTGQCDGVRRMQPRVERADPVYYQEVFLADAAIARCLAQPLPPEGEPEPIPDPAR